MSEELKRDRDAECAQRNCRHKHKESERARVPHKKMAGVMQTVCPKCGCDSYYDLTKEKAKREQPA